MRYTRMLWFLVSLLLLSSTQTLANNNDSDRENLLRQLEAIRQNSGEELIASSALREGLGSDFQDISEKTDSGRTYFVSGSKVEASVAPTELLSLQ